MLLTKIAVGCMAAGLFVSSLFGAGDKKEPLAAADIKLPKPAYVGTPKNVPEGVAKPTDKPREKPMWPAGATNLAAKKPVSSSDKEPIIGSLSQITDGDKEATEGSYVELNPGPQWVQLDLGKKADICGIVVWHRHAEPRVYKAVVVQVCNDPDFIGDVKTVFNNDKENALGMGLGKDPEFVEYFEGWLIDIYKTGAQVQGRYIRLHSKGNTSDEQNHYTEVEVWGKDAK
jgi:hypothetical protein